MTHDIRLNTLQAIEKRRIIMVDKDKLKALELAVGQIEKQFGKGSIMRLDKGEIPANIAAISTGSLGLDVALGIGGVPRGRIIEVYGPESSGKTTLALNIIAQAQKTGGQAAFIDAEHALDVAYARKLGVKTDELLISQPDTGEQALEITETLVRSGAIDVIVVDSVAALTPRAEIEGEMGDAHMGLQARLMSQALRKLTGAISKSNTTLVFINQIRMKIGVMFGNPETTTGGNALKFYASVRLDIRKVSAIKEGEEVTGGRVRVKVVKNKIAPPFRSAEFDVMFNEGISKLGEIIDIGAEKNIIEKSGAWFSYGGTRIGQGRENVKIFLNEHPEMAAEIEVKVRESYGLKPVGAPLAAAQEKEAKEKEAPAEKEKPAKASRGKDLRTS
jgi:recombination protein RecA